MSKASVSRRGQSHPIPPAKEDSGTASSITFNVTAFPATQNHFFASEFKIKRDNYMLVMLFGYVSSFSEHVESFYKALELRMPIELAQTAFVQQVWINKSLNTSGPLIETVKSVLTLSELNEAENYKCVTQPPKELSTNNFYSDSVSAATTSIVGKRGSIEFIRIPDGMFTRRSLSREGERQPSSVVIVDMDVHRLYAFLFSVRNLLDENAETNFGKARETR